MKIKILILCLALLSLFTTKEASAMKIYIYNDSKKPRCANLWTGYFLDFETHKEIGFGDDSTTANDGSKEHTKDEYIDYISSIGGNVGDALNIYNKLDTLSNVKFNNIVVSTKEEVRKISTDKINRLFSDPEGIMSTVQYKEILMAKMICVLIADSGRIKYEETNIPGVTDRESADAFIANLLPKWLAAEQIRITAEQYIIDNNL